MYSMYIHVHSHVQQMPPKGSYFRKARHLAVETCWLSQKVDLKSGEMHPQEMCFMYDNIYIFNYFVNGK